MHPTFFTTAAAFRKWLEKHHASATELLVGFLKKGSGKPTITYQEALDEALAFGWIDGVRRSHGDDSYTIRFTPRKPRSIWSAVNMKRVGELTAAGRMTEAGLAAFARRDPARSAIYAYEREAAALDESALAALRADGDAWEFYAAQAAYYRRVTAHWVMSAKRSQTRERRLATLIECSRNGQRIPALSYAKKRG